MATDVADVGLKQLTETMAREGFDQRLATLHLDISDQHACAASVEATRERLGTLDILINNGALGMVPSVTTT
jgi:NAD(P)-dependent dehydrogenase (short-subunit alcohol dehydrogenase family)